MRRNLWLHCIVVSALATFSAGARADHIYSADRLTDTATGRVWTHGLLPTATFIPTGNSTVATTLQLQSLASTLGIDPSPNFENRRSYSAEIAAFVNWYGDFSRLYAGPDPEIGHGCNGPNGGGNCFLAINLGHHRDDAGLWTTYLVSTSVPPTFWLTLSASAALARRRRRL